MNGPSSFYTQHHQVEAPRIDGKSFRPAWRRLSRLDGLLLEKRITPTQHAAAIEFRELYEEAEPRGPRSALADLNGAYRATQSQPTPHRYDAAKYLRGVVLSLGPRRYKWLVLMVVEDIAWTALAQRFRIDVRTAKKRAVQAIVLLGLLTTAR